jgi:hypothetical protein
MRKMVMSAVVAVTSVLVLSGVVLAAPATPRCDSGIPGLTLNTPGDVNKELRTEAGSPGQNTLSLPANEAAALYNQIRKTLCPNPS